MDWSVILFIVGVALLWWWWYVAFGQYVAHPERRTYDHVRNCTDCRKRIIDGPPSAQYEDWLCDAGRKLYDRYGA